MTSAPAPVAVMLAAGVTGGGSVGPTTRVPSLPHPLSRVTAARALSASFVIFASLGRGSGRFPPAIRTVSLAKSPRSHGHVTPRARGRMGGWDTSASVPGDGLAVLLLADRVLLELLVQVRARGPDRGGGGGDVPAALAQLLHDERALGRGLEVLQRAGGLSGGGAGVGGHARAPQHVGEMLGLD